MEIGESRLMCYICEKKFGSVSARNQHLKIMHKVEVTKTVKHICCPICPEDQKDTLGTHDDLISHLTRVHGISIKQSNLNFRSIEEFEAWRALGNREVDYACLRKNKCSNGDTNVYYNCNRSNSKGFQSNCTKRAMKTGGSIRISGICPSRLCVKFLKNGMVDVKFIETHVGHQDELRTKRLLKQKQKMVVEQLNAGVTNESILQDARKIKDGQLERINLITRGDELCQCLDKKSINEHGKSINFKRRQQIQLEEFHNYARNLDEETFDKFMDMIRIDKNNLERMMGTNHTCKKRKIGDHMYYKKYRYLCEEVRSLGVGGGLPTY